MGYLLVMGVWSDKRFRRVSLFPVIESFATVRCFFSSFFGRYKHLCAECCINSQRIRVNKLFREEEAFLKSHRWSGDIGICSTSDFDIHDDVLRITESEHMYISLGMEVRAHMGNFELSKVSD